MGIRNVLRAYQAKDEAFFTESFGLNKEAAFKVIKAVSLSLAAEKKATRQARLDKLTPQQREELQAKRTARLQKLRKSRKAETLMAKKAAAEVVLAAKKSTTKPKVKK